MLLSQVNVSSVGTASTVGRGDWYVFAWCVWGAEVFSFSFLNSFLTPAFLWLQSNLNWKGSLDAIWSKLCWNQVTETRAAHAVLVALGLTKAGSSEGGVLASHGCQIPAHAAGFARVLVGWDMTAGQRPSSSLPSSSSAEQAALQKAACFAAGIWVSGSVGVKGMYRVRVMVISSWWVLVFKSFLPLPSSLGKDWNTDVFAVLASSVTLNLFFF